jgi:hypothetical protein
MADAERSLIIAAGMVNHNQSYPLQYSCESLLQTGVRDALQELQVRFDYEFVAEGSSVDLLAQSLPAFEWSSLWIVADMLGLHGCYHMDQQKYVYNVPKPTIIAGLSSLAVDSLDTSVGAFVCCNLCKRPLFNASNLSYFRLSPKQLAANS